mmetsp:Transcript_44081/g.71775  ORF Transcript_44081/g.71775 Transcript_44081/m.71775 type:complete len:290 (-) Transcript_44081:313-1182(-)|eukprot:CAMPEP_0184661160 /NCGR_PEP_ID=MMETSP0308-20130426/37203_1 /TAXON_ID=38269 /ORGANISM="Gloeochaete witrockiana, Strain SAG 46.84" /LENGTH=289 /DNA_ID=CAMNT_0027102269 /DNA_START=103 /DNA_END=972 /DNA_ORIENTATION=+
MKTRSQTYIYKVSWELALEAYELRYPTNPHQPFLVGSEVVEHVDRVDEKTTVSFKKRMSTVSINAPEVLKKLIGHQTITFVQNTWINKTERSLRIETINETFSGRVKMGDTTIYRQYVGANGEDWTLFEQTAFLSLPSIFGLQSQLESFCIKTFSKNSEKAREVDLIFLEQVLSNHGQSLSSIPPPILAPISVTPVAENISHHPPAVDPRLHLMKFPDLDSPKTSSTGSSSGSLVSMGEDDDTSTVTKMPNKDSLELVTDQSSVLSSAPTKRTWPLAWGLRKPSSTSTV